MTPETRENLRALGVTLGIAIVLIGIIYLLVSCDLQQQQACRQRGGTVEWIGAGHAQYGGCKLPRHSP